MLGVDSVKCVYINQKTRKAIVIVFIGTNSIYDQYPTLYSTMNMVFKLSYEHLNKLECLVKEQHIKLDFINCSVVIYSQDRSIDLLGYKTEDYIMRTHNDIVIYGK